MAAYNIAGRADDVDYAEAERLCDLLLAFLPECTVVKFRKHPDHWPGFAKRIEESLGVHPVESSIVWTPSGRVIGTLAAFAVYVYRRYGVVCDLNRKQLGDNARVNLAESLVDLEREKVAEKQLGKRALIVVDMQNDFLKGGALAVPGGNDVIPLVNELLRSCTWDLVVYTQDFHPKGHPSFASAHRGAKPFETRTIPGLGSQVMWPDHCVQGSLGAAFHPYLTTTVPCKSVTLRKGTSMQADSYSGFGDAKGREFEDTGLANLLGDEEISDVYVCGLALDYCVGCTAKDAVKDGFNTFLVLDATRGITPAGGDATVGELVKEGVHVNVAALFSAMHTVDVYHRDIHIHNVSYDTLTHSTGLIDWDQSAVVTAPAEQEKWVQQEERFLRSLEVAQSRLGVE